MTELPRSEYEKLIDEWILNERDRKIMKRRLLDAITYERLAEEFDMSDYYDFIGMTDMADLHEQRFCSESEEMRKVHRYFIEHHNMLVPKNEVDSTSHIPQSWYGATRFKVDNGTRRNAVQQAMEKWIEWERMVKKKYEGYYKDLCDMGEVASACKVKCLVMDVDEELKNAEALYLKLAATNFVPAQ